MTTFTIHTTTQAPAQSLPLLTEVQSKYSFVPNLFGALAEAPAALRNKTVIADARLQALAEFTRAVVATRGEVGSKEMESFLAAGYDRQQVLEVILGVAMKTLSNYANNLMHTPLDAPFQPETWSGINA